MVSKTIKTAFTMIELIFAIVVIAIAVVSLPMMMQVNSKGMENNLAQEVIFAASVELMQASTGYWDANSMKDFNVSDYSRVVNIGSICDSITKLRPGNINQPFHRRCIDSNTTTNASNAIGNPNFQTLDDFEHPPRALYVGSANGAAGYKNMNYTSKLDVNQSAADSNIKILTVTVFDNTNKIVTVLRTQSANVGEPQYHKRTF